MGVPFALRRPLLLVRGKRARRDQPDLDHLRSIEDPMDFVWTILPHAARTFAASILLLRARHALTAAVAYLYCRMLDTYEDLSPPDERETALRSFAARMTTMEKPPPLSSAHARSVRDQTHILLIDRCALVDVVYAALPAADQRRIAQLVAAMADGMVWSSQRFREQGGVLVDEDQLRRYCHHVIGEPVLFTLVVVLDDELTAEQRCDALASSELIQLANITRDIEQDLERGIGYSPLLQPYLGEVDAADPIRCARRDLMTIALPQAAAFKRLAQTLATQRFSPARAAAVLMLLHTDRHYQWCAGRIGLTPWRHPVRSTVLVLQSLPAAVSRRWSWRIMDRIERDFLSAHRELTASLPDR